MKTNASFTILLRREETDGLHNCFRLIRTFDAFQGADVYSVFLTTEDGGECTEDFVYDISRDYGEVKRFFDLLCRNGATATHLRELAEDFIASVS